MALKVPVLEKGYRIHFLALLVRMAQGEPISKQMLKPRFSESKLMVAAGPWDFKFCPCDSMDGHPLGK